MEFTIYISKSVFWFAAGIVACIVSKILWHKFIVPGYIYCVEMIQRKRDEKSMDYNHLSKKYVYLAEDEDTLEADFYEEEKKTSS